MADPNLSVVLSVFSGNRDPELSLPSAAEDELANRLAQSFGQQAAGYVEPPGLGYRGFIVTNTGQLAGVPAVSRVFGGTISVSDQEGHEQTWADTSQTEQFLVGQARELGYGKILDEVGFGQPSV